MVRRNRDDQRQSDRADFAENAPACIPTDKQAVLKRVHDFCRTCGVAKLGVQLAHAGRKGPTRPPAASDKPILSEEESSATPEAPSARTTDYPGFNRWRGRARPDPSIGRHDCFERFLRQPLWLLPDQTTGHNLPAAFAYKILLSHSSTCRVSIDRPCIQTHNMPTRSAHLARCGYEKLF